VNVTGILTVTNTIDSLTVVTNLKPLRERNRWNAMRATQAAALDLIEARGYLEVTIEDVAADAGVSASSVYRYFGTKEAIFLWDEADMPLLDDVAARLTELPPLEAIRSAIHQLVDGRFERDPEGMRRRLRLIYSTPALEAAARNQTEAFRQALAAILAAEGGDLDRLQVRVKSAAAVGALTAAIEEWAATDGKRPFAEVVDQALDVLAGGIEA
jgi:AcrR family transcriptional regulator